jgi:hypothetical protein
LFFAFDQHDGRELPVWTTPQLGYFRGKHGVELAAARRHRCPEDEPGKSSDEENQADSKQSKCSHADEYGGLELGSLEGRVSIR